MSVLAEIFPAREVSNEQNEPPESLKQLVSLLLFQRAALNQLGPMSPYESILNLQVWKCPVENLRSLLGEMVADFDGNVLQERRRARQQ